MLNRNPQLLYAQQQHSNVSLRALPGPPKTALPTALCVGSSRAINKTVQQSGSISSCASALSAACKSSSLLPVVAHEVCLFTFELRAGLATYVQLV
jgi:hypothetical protein